jgi:hypothetical protein
MPSSSSSSPTDSKATACVVVLTYNFYPAEVKEAIDGLMKTKFGLMVGTVTYPDGKTEQLSEAFVTAMVLNEFYQKIQVMIGEAVAGSEVETVIKAHSSELHDGDGTQGCAGQRAQDERARVFYAILGRFLPKSVACSKACAICSTEKSALLRPTICTPTGSPSGVKPPGTEAAGLPVVEMYQQDFIQSM